MIAFKNIFGQTEPYSGDWLVFVLPVVVGILLIFKLTEKRGN